MRDNAIIDLLGSIRDTYGETDLITLRPGKWHLPYNEILFKKIEEAGYTVNMDGRDWMDVKSFSKSNYTVYLDVNHLSEHYLLAGNYGKSFAIFDFDGHLLDFDFNEDTFYIDNVKVDIEDVYLRNAVAVLKFLYHFSESFLTNEYIDYIDWDHKRLSIFSSGNRIDIKIPEKPPTFDNPVQESCEAFLELLDSSNKGLPLFLKSATVQILSTKDSEMLFSAWIENLDSIIKRAKINFDIYLHGLSIENIQAEYRKYKSRYFDEINQIISKLSLQVIALPASVSAVLFAVFKLRESQGALILILMFCVLFTALLYYISISYASDILFLSRNIDHDYNSILGQEFFVKNKDEIRYFKQIKDDLDNKVCVLKNINCSFRMFLIIMIIAVSAYIIIPMSHDICNFIMVLFY